jgi:hypothetical protein
MPDYLKIFYRKKNERLLFLFFDIKSINQATIKKNKEQRRTNGKICFSACQKQFDIKIKRFSAPQKDLVEKRRKKNNLNSKSEIRLKSLA